MNEKRNLRKSHGGTPSAYDLIGRTEDLRSALFRNRGLRTKRKGMGIFRYRSNCYSNPYSEMGQGTTFKIFLPVVECDVENDILIPQSTFLGGTETILIAEDEEALRNLARDVLEALNYTILLAKDGVEAVEMYRRDGGRTELLLLDVVMPRLGGWEVYERICELGGDVPRSS